MLGTIISNTCLDRTNDQALIVGKLWGNNDTVKLQKHLVLLRFTLWAPELQRGAILPPQAMGPGLPLQRGVSSHLYFET